MPSQREEWPPYTAEQAYGGVISFYSYDASRVNIQIEQSTFTGNYASSLNQTVRNRGGGSGSRTRAELGRIDAA